MPRRISVPDDHVAVILPTQLADDVMSLAKIVRQRRSRIASDDAERGSLYEVAGAVMLALLEAKEA